MSFIPRLVLGRISNPAGFLGPWLWLLSSVALPAVLSLVAPPTPHPTRTRILEHLRLLPGDHLRSIARSLSVSLGEARYHLHVLHRSGAVHEEKVRHRARYYSAEPGPQAERNTLFQKHWKHRDLRARVLQAVQVQEAPRPSEVARAAGISRQLASYHLVRLTESGHIAREGRGYRIVSPESPTPRGAGPASPYREFPP